MEGGSGHDGKEEKRGMVEGSEGMDVGREEGEESVRGK